MSRLLNEKKIRFNKMKPIDKGDSTLSHLASSPLLNLIQEWRLVVHCGKKKCLQSIWLSQKLRGGKNGREECLDEKGKRGEKMVRLSDFLFGPTKFHPPKYRREN